MAKMSLRRRRGGQIQYLMKPDIYLGQGAAGPERKLVTRCDLDVSMQVDNIIF